jgi:hypothetical protein
MKKYMSRFLSILAFGFFLGGCGDDFLPPSYLDDLRVLALVPDPVEVGPTDEVTLMPYVYLPEEDTLVDETWTFCPFSLGPTSGYQCAVPACETELFPEPDGSIRATPGALAFECVSQLSGGESPEGVPSEIPEQVDVYFNYQARSSSGQTRDAVFKQVLWTQGPPPAPNGSPVFESLEVGDQTVSQGETADPVAENGEVEFRVRIDPDSLDSYVDEADRSRTEEVILSFYTSAGRFEFGRLAGVDVSLKWEAKELEPGQTLAEVYVVARDLRGGQAVFGPLFVPLLR